MYFFISGFLLLQQIGGLFADTTLNDSYVHSVDNSQALSGELGKLFDSTTGCNFNVVVSSPTGEPVEEVFCIHSFILLLNPELTFYNSAQNSSSFTMEVSHDCQPYVTNFLRYLYTRQIDITIASVRCLHQMASDFGLKLLQAELAKLFSWLLPKDGTFKTTLSMYDNGICTNDKVLQEICLRYMAWNCKALIDTDTWVTMAPKTMENLLSRSDLIVPDETVLLHGLESWLLARSNETSLSTVVTMLNQIRFSMISAEMLYDLQFNSDMYEKYTEVYDAAIAKGYPYQILTYQKLIVHMQVVDKKHSPRIYAGDPWSYTITAADISSYQQNHYDSYRSWNNGMSRSFSTPVFNNALFLDKTISWSLEVCLSNDECARQGYACDSGLAAKLYPSGYNQYYDGISYNNMIMMVCDSGYISHVQQFKDNVACLPANSTSGQAYPCLTQQYSLHFVIRPEYKISASSRV